MSNSDFATRQMLKISQRIIAAATQANRQPNEIRLIGASKMQDSQKLVAFVQQGLVNVGENYLQEAIQKQQDLNFPDLEWHFIGQVQSNKTALICKHFHWVHGVDRLKIAQRLNVHSVDRACKMLLQINIDKEESKSGAAIEQVPQLCDAISQLDNIELHGFMIIPRARNTPDPSPYAKSNELLARVNQQYGLDMQHLSMGMSKDLEVAIAEGATMVRIGSDLFGSRA